MKSKEKEEGCALAGANDVAESQMADEIRSPRDEISRSIDRQNNPQNRSFRLPSSPQREKAGSPMTRIHATNNSSTMK